MMVPRRETPEPPVEAPDPLPEASQTPLAPLPEASSPLPEASSTPVAPPPQPLEGTLSDSRLLRDCDLVLAAGLIVLAFLLGSFALKNADFWQHAATGRLFVQHKYEFGKPQFTYTGTDRCWTNHSWLYDIGCYLLYTFKEPDGGRVVVVVKCVLIALLAFVLLQIRAPGGGIWISVLAIGLALLTSAPRFIMSPEIVSYLLLATTLLLLLRQPAAKGGWKLPLSVGAVFWLWSNCDQWFFIGPVTVLLFVLGELIEQVWRPSLIASRPDPKTLGVTLAVGVVACMLNPHFLHVWTLPAELVSGDLYKAIGKDPQFSPYFANVFDRTILDWDGSHGGNPVNAFAFALLFVLNAASYIVNRQHYSLGLMLVNVALLGLAIYHGLALPYYAIVAAASTALNWGAFFARAGGRTFSLNNLFLLAIGRAGARVALLTAGLLALAACYPGWLQPLRDQRRLAWDAEPDAGFVKTAATMESWRTSERLPPDAHSLIFSMKLAGLCAWYAPSEPTFFDTRLTFHAPEAEQFMSLKRSLVNRKANPGKPPDIDYDALRKRQITHVVFASQNRADVINGIDGMLDERADGLRPWILWDIVGRGAIFGWQGQKVIDPARFKGMTYSETEQAYAPTVEPLPDPKVFAPEPEREFLAKYLVPLPEVSADTEEAWFMLAYGRDCTIIYNQTVERFKEKLIADRNVKTYVGGALGARALLDRYPARTTIDSPIKFDFQAGAILGIRLARRGIVDQPGAAAGYLALADCYDVVFWPGASNSLKYSVVVGNLGRYFARLSPEEMAKPSVQTQKAAFQLYLMAAQGPWRDLVLADLKLGLDLSHRLHQDDRQKFEENVKKIEGEIKQREQDLQRQEDAWWNAKTDPFRFMDQAGFPRDQRHFAFESGTQIPIRDAELAKVLLAAQLFGLHGKAVETLQGIDLRSDKVAFDQQVCAVVLLSHLLVLGGKPEEAHQLLGRFLEEREEMVGRAPELRALLFTAVNETLLVLGRLEELEKNLTMINSEWRVELEKFQRDAALQQAMAVTFVRQLGHQVSPIAWLDNLLNVVNPSDVDAKAGRFSEGHRILLQRIEDTEYHLAMVCLERGSNVKAAQHFREVFKRATRGSPHWTNAEFYLRSLERQ
jgi:hypothetical protein